MHTTANAVIESSGGKGIDPDQIHIDETVNNLEVKEWSCFPGSQVVQSWANEIKQALAINTSSERWHLIGTAAVIQHENHEVRCIEIFRRIAMDCGMRFAIISAEDATQFRLNSNSRFDELAPMLIYLERGDWMGEADEKKTGSDRAKEIQHFQQELKKRLHNFDPAHPVIFTTSVKDCRDIEESLRQAGLFDRRFFIPLPPLPFVGEEFIGMVGRDICDESLTDSPGKVGKLVSTEYDERTKALSALALQRLAHREKRKVKFCDLVRFCKQTTIESDPEPLENDSIRGHVAVHEAGHAAVSVLDSGGRNIPDYSTIISHDGSCGMVTGSYDYYFSKGGLKTYEDFRHRIRVGLAGRAAEEVVFGSGKVSAGAESDLEDCTKHATAAFARWGFAPGMDDPANSSLNLAVLYDGCGGTASEWEHVENLVRKFLSEEYLIVLKMLSEQRQLLGAISVCLLQLSVLDQQEMTSICSGYIDEINAQPTI